MSGNRPGNVRMYSKPNQSNRSTSEVSKQANRTNNVQHMNQEGKRLASDNCNAASNRARKGDCAIRLKLLMCFCISKVNVTIKITHIK
jgi:hypothetical protein